MKAATFHRYCDNKGETFTILSSTNGYLFGGYVDVNWTKTERIPTYHSSTRAFLFSLMNSKKIPATKYPINLQYRDYAIVNDHLSGPIFGTMEQPDVGIYEFKNQFRCQVNFPSVYRGDSVVSGFPTSSSCIINEIEVFIPIFELPMHSMKKQWDFDTLSSFLGYPFRTIYFFLSYIVGSIFSFLASAVHSIYLFLSYVFGSIFETWVKYSSVRKILLVLVLLLVLEGIVLVRVR